MFGGLLVKGTANDDKKSESAPAAPAPASTSAFSFMTGAVVPAARENPPPTATSDSAFSFMTVAASKESIPEATMEAKVPVAAAASAFSFMSPVSADSTSLSVNPNDTQKKGTTTTPPPASGFDFMSSTSKPSPVSDQVASTPTAPVGNSGFSFLSSSDPPAAAAVTTEASLTAEALAVSASPPSSIITRSESPSTILSSLSSPDIVATSNPHQPAGSGVVFGGAVTATAAKKKVMKKRVRGARVGAAAHTATASCTTPTTALPVVVAAAPLPPSGYATSNEEQTTMQQQPQQKLEVDDSKQASLEAARRAEEFMQEKMRDMAARAEEHSTISIEQQQSTPRTPLPSLNNTVSSPDNDVEYSAAKAAAEGAKTAMSGQPKKGFRMGFGGLFNKNKKGGGGGGTSVMNSSNASDGISIPEPEAVLSAGSTNASLGSRGISGPPADAAHVETAAERIQREQEEINRAMAQRQLAMQQKQGKEFTPPSPLSMSTPPTIGQSSFKPAKPPTPARPPPIPRGPLKPEEVLESILKDFAKATQASTDRVAQLRQQRAKLLEEKTAATTKELFVSQQISHAEAQQGAAAELEDFDLADRLGAVIEIHLIEKREQTIILGNIGRALSMLDEQRDSVVGAVASCFAQVHTKLDTLAQKQETKDKKDDSDCIRRYTNTAKQLSAENERLLKDLKHVERDEELLSEEKGELEGAIGEQTATLAENRDESNDKLQRVKEEIAELKKQMREKETVAADLKADFDQVESAIAKVRKNFSRQAARVQNKEAAVKEHRKEWKGEQARYERDKKCHDEEVNTHSEDLLKHDEIMLRLKTEMNNASVFKEIVEAGDVVVYESTSAGDVGMSPEDGERTELGDLHENVVEGEAALLEANHVLKAADVALVSLRQEHEELFERIPLLEAEKKDAATRRDFKAAGKASKEIKDLTARLKECEADLNGDAAANVKKSKATLESLQESLDTKKELMHEKQKEQGSSAMRDLATTIKRLKSCKIKLCSASTGLNVLVVGASVLDCQINTLRKEGEVYDAKYGGWEQTLTEIVGETFDDQIDSENTALHSDSETVEDSKSGKSTQDEGVSSKGAVSESRDVKIEKFKNVMGKLKEAEDALEAAVAIEDFDQAAELDEVFQQLQTDLVALGLTDEDMEIAISDDAVKENDDSTLGETKKSVAKSADEDPAAENEQEDEVTETVTSGDDTTIKGTDVKEYDDEETNEYVATSVDEDPAAENDQEDDVLGTVGVEADATSEQEEPSDEKSGEANPVNIEVEGEENYLKEEPDCCEMTEEKDEDNKDCKNTDVESSEEELELSHKESKEGSNGEDMPDQEADERETDES